MPKAGNRLLHGTLDTLILKTLSYGPRHGYAVARWIEGETMDAERISVGFLSSSMLPTLGVAPLLGRGFSPEEDVPDGPQVAVLDSDLPPHHMRTVEYIVSASFAGPQVVTTCWGSSR